MGTKDLSKAQHSSCSLAYSQGIYISDARTEANLPVQEYACDLCGRNDEEFLYTKLGVLTRYPFRLVRCRSCGLMYLNPRLSEKAISDLYDHKYYSGEGFDTHVNYLEDLSREDDQTKVARAGETIDILTELVPAPAVHLDFGCGVGDLLRQGRRRGYQSEGFEVSQFAREFLKQHGFTVFDQPDKIPTGRYDIVTAVEVLEHCSSPLAALRLIYDALKPGGIFYYTTCNFDRFYEKFRANRLDRLCDEYIKPEGHIHFFSTGVMEKYFRKIGFGNVFPFEPRHYVREGRTFELLSKLGLIGPGTLPNSLLHKAAYYGGRRCAIKLGLRKPLLPLAQK